MFTVTRSAHNPILAPNKGHTWEAEAAFNGCPVVVGKKTHLFYRALSEPQLLKEPRIRMSVIGRATRDIKGPYFKDRQVMVQPDQPFDQFGCEDPRVTKFGKKYYIFYTALGGHPFSAENIRTAVAVTTDLKTVAEKHLVTPFNSKGMAMFPEKVNGKIGVLLTVNTENPPSDICYAEFDRIEDMWSSEKWLEWRKNLDAHKISIRRLPGDHLEVGAAPIMTDKGWLVVYAHIQRYGRDDVVFGIEAVLLDKDNPRDVIGRTQGPFMVPDTYYEEVGIVPRIVFPSGVLIKDGKLKIYYGAADTFCAKASIPLDNLLKSMMGTEKRTAVRYPGNPIIAPRPGFFWEAGGTFNPAAIELGNKIHILYRASSDMNVSTVGYAVSKDGLTIDERSDKPVYVPRSPFERNDHDTRNYGCEDPRIVNIGGKLYMTYTAYDGSTPRVAVTSISTKDFLAKKWSAWSEPQVITQPNVVNKDAAILPEAINGKYMVFHRVNESICADFVSSLDFSKEKVDECIELISPRRGMWDGGKVGISSPPVRTKEGWLLLYHGVSWSTTYRVGAVLLDLKDPTIVLARSANPLFQPEADYELKGLIPNVVFPCGLVMRGNDMFMYYGAADSVVGVAMMKLTDVLRGLKT